MRSPTALSPPADPLATLAANDANSPPQAMRS